MSVSLVTRIFSIGAAVILMRLRKVLVVLNVNWQYQYEPMKYFILKTFHISVH